MRQLPTRAARGIAALLSLAVATPALAQVKLDGFALQGHEPSYAGDRFFAVPDAPVTGHLAPALQLTFNYGHAPLQLVNAATGRVVPDGTLVRNQLYLHLDASLSLFERVRVNLSLPFAAWQSGDSPFGAESVRGGQVGDLRLGARVALLGTAADTFALGLQADLFIPTGSRRDWAGDGIARGHPRLVASGLVSDRWLYAVALGAMIRSHDDQGIAEVGTALTYSAAAAWRTWDARLQLGPELSGATTFAGGTTALEAMLGAKVCLPADLVAGAGIGAGLTHAPGSAAVRVLASVAWEPGRGCWASAAEEARKADAVQAQRATVLDADGDGIPDDQDRCPYEPETKNGLRDEDGCPESDASGGALTRLLVGQAPAGQDPVGSGSRTAAEAQPGAAPNDRSNDFSSRDSDHDQVPDAFDRCPLTAEDPDGFEDEDGCPDLDNDEDGVPDRVDACPDSAETVNGFEDQDGCPDVAPDQDGDGVSDAADRCPLEPGDPSDGCPHLPLPALALPGFPGFKGTSSTPATGAMASTSSTGAQSATTPDARNGIRADSDGDGIPDDEDLCPATKEDPDGFEDEDGCPDLDNDGDGIPDRDDACPLVAETINGVKDSDGCPDVGQAAVVVTDRAVEIKGTVRFGLGSAALLPEAHTLLQQVAATLRAHATVSVEVQGHTDDRGDAALNTALSQRRADTIKAFLVGAGVSADRVVARGYGPTKPRAPNTTAAGREQNRRVEFVIMGAHQ